MTSSWNRAGLRAVALMATAAAGALLAGPANAADVVVIPPPVTPVVVDIPPAHRFYIDVDALYMTRRNPAAASLVQDVQDLDLLNAEDFDFGWEFGVEARAGFVSGGGIGVEIGGFWINPFLAIATNVQGAAGDMVIQTNPVSTFAQLTDIRANNATWLWGADANVTFSPSPMLMVFGGVAYVRLTDVMLIQLSAAGGVDNHFTWTTTNSMLGPQLGARITVGDPGGVSVMFEGRGAYLFSGVDVAVLAQYDDVLPPDRTGAAAEDARTWMLAGKAKLGYQVNERLNIHVGYQAMWFSNVAMAPAQVAGTDDLAPGGGAITVTPQYGPFLTHGAMAGFMFTF